MKLTFIDGRVLKIDLFSNTHRSRQLPLKWVNHHRLQRWLCYCKGCEIRQKNSTKVNDFFLLFYLHRNVLRLCICIHTPFLIRVNPILSTSGKSLLSTTALTAYNMPDVKYITRIRVRVHFCVTQNHLRTVFNHETSPNRTCHKTFYKNIVDACRLNETKWRYVMNENWRNILLFPSQTLVFTLVFVVR